MDVRIGLGYDVHQFMQGDSVLLGGVEIPCRYSLKGHSDADVLLHAITDAILGALSLGDIGTHFPDTDPAWKGADSKELLKQAYALVKEEGYILGNVDATVVTEEPRLKGYIDAIQQSIAECFECEPGRISVKATTSEKMGFVGREEGIAVHAVSLLKKLTD
jgi:2-C-methyl-D-erythritol 2,4-cyclodiphosphate synthase